MRPYALLDILPSTNLQTARQTQRILDSLRGPVAGGGEVGVGAVADLDDAGERRGPAGLRVAPEELEVDDGVGGRAFHELFEDWCPFLRAGDLVEAVEHFGGFDRVGPGFGLGARGLGDWGLVVGRERETGGEGRCGSYIVVYDPDH